MFDRVLNRHLFREIFQADVNPVESFATRTHTHKVGKYWDYLKSSEGRSPFIDSLT